MVPLFFAPKISQKKFFQKGLLYIPLRKIPQKKKSYIGLFFHLKKFWKKISRTSSCPTFGSA
jgi:hypothetical protein